MKKTSDGKVLPVPRSLETMVEIFNTFLQASSEVIEKAEGMAEEVRVCSGGVGMCGLEMELSVAFRVDNQFLLLNSQKCA